MKISINSENYERLELFKEILNKDESQIINEALKRYFDEEQQRLVDEDIAKQRAQSTLDYNDFWDGVDI